jgi:hypothetical protein
MAASPEVEMGSCFLAFCFFWCVMICRCPHLGFRVWGLGLLLLVRDDLQVPTLGLLVCTTFIGCIYVLVVLLVMCATRSVSIYMYLCVHVLVMCATRSVSIYMYLFAPPSVRVYMH